MQTQEAQEILNVDKVRKIHYAKKVKDICILIFFV